MIYAIIFKIKSNTEMTLKIFIRVESRAILNLHACNKIPKIMKENLTEWQGEDKSVTVVGDFSTSLFLWLIRRDTFKDTDELINPLINLYLMSTHSILQTAINKYIFFLSAHYDSYKQLRYTILLDHLFLKKINLEHI